MNTAFTDVTFDRLIGQSFYNLAQLDLSYEKIFSIIIDKFLTHALQDNLGDGVVADYIYLVDGTATGVFLTSEQLKKIADFIKSFFNDEV